MQIIVIVKRTGVFSWHRLRWKENLYSSTDKRDGGNLLYFYTYNLPLGVCSASYELAKSISISHSWRLTLKLVFHLYMTQHSLHMTIRTNRFCTLTENLFSSHRSACAKTTQEPVTLCGGNVCTRIWWLCKMTWEDHNKLEQPLTTISTFLLSRRLVSSNNPSLAFSHSPISLKTMQLYPICLVCSLSSSRQKVYLHKVCSVIGR